MEQHELFARCAPTNESKQAGSNHKAKHAKALAPFMAGNLLTDRSRDLPLWEASSWHLLASLAAVLESPLAKP
jgi:hypothetical protein